MRNEERVMDNVQRQNIETVNEFYDLDTWKKGHKLVLEVYKITESFPKEEIYGMVSQLRRSVTSITANIAEGFSRYHYKEKERFYYNARGSISEVQNFLLIARDVGYLRAKDCDFMMQSAREVRMLLNGLIRSIEKQIRKSSA